MPRHNIIGFGQWIPRLPEAQWIWAASSGDDPQHGLIVSQSVIDDHGGIDLTEMTAAMVRTELEHICTDCYYSLTRDSALADSLSDNLPPLDSPDYMGRWMERYLDEVHDPDILINRAVIASADNTDPDSMMMPCLDMACNGTSWASPEALEVDVAPIVACPECGNFSCVPLSSLMRGGDQLQLGLAALARSPVSSRVNHRVRWRFMIDERQNNPEVVELHGISPGVRRNIIMFGFNGDYFRRERDHFIRARANFETLSEILHLSEWDATTTVGWNVLHLIDSPPHVWEQLVVLIRKISADPTAILDEGKAESIRTRLVDEEWGNEEYRRFLRLLAETGILRDNSSEDRFSSSEDRLGLEFWNHLYKSVINRLELRPIIKRTGRVTFPSAAVVAGITLSGIEKAWRDFVTPGTGTIEEFFDADKLGANLEAGLEEAGVVAG
jgi:hypothetical protein